MDMNHKSLTTIKSFVRKSLGSFIRINPDKHMVMIAHHSIGHHLNSER